MGKYNNENNQPLQKRKLIFILLLLIVILIATNGWSFYLYVKNNGDKTVSEIDKYNLLNPARNFFKQEDLIINLQPLRDYLNDKYEKDSNVSIYFEYLPTGASIAINKDADFYPASLLKVPIAMAVTKKIERGEWKWTNELVLMSPDKDEHFGDLYREKTGATFTIEELVRRSLSDSDNTAHFILIRNLELSEINDVYAHIGLDKFLETDGSISAKRYSVILRSLYNSSYLSNSTSQKIISFLTEEKSKEYLGSALPENIAFAHKTGIDIGKKIYLDSGIIYLTDRPYILAVMTKSKTEQQAKDIMKDVSDNIFNYVKNYK